MEIVYTHDEAGYSYTCNTKVYGLRKWKEFIRRNADHVGSYTLSHKGKVIRIGYGIRQVDAQGKAFLLVSERAV